MITLIKEMKLQFNKKQDEDVPFNFEKVIKKNSNLKNYFYAFLDINTQFALQQFTERGARYWHVILKG